MIRILVDTPQEYESIESAMDQESLAEFEFQLGYSDPKLVPQGEPVGCGRTHSVDFTNEIIIENTTGTFVNLDDPQ